MTLPLTDVAGWHCFEALGQRILLNVATSLYFRVSNVVYDLVSRATAQGWEQGLAYVRKRYRKRDVAEALASLEELQSGEAPPVVKPPRGLGHIELSVTHACNLACRYCYGCTENGRSQTGPRTLYGGTAAHMPESIALEGVDLLLRESARRKEVGITFFGGEPFLNLPLLERTAAYAKDAAAHTGKKLSLSVVTNGTLLNNDALRFVKAHNVSVQISIDGPPELHDNNRPFPDGRPTYDLVMQGVRRLARARKRRIPARVTASRNGFDNPAVFEHLAGLGFGSVHIEPALGDSGDGTCLRAADIGEYLRQEEDVAARFLAHIRAGRYLNYHGLVRFIRDTRVVHQRRQYYCGAGRGLVCVSNDGDLYPCHRFLGKKDYVIGTVDSGIDAAKRRPFTELRVDARPGCRDCWARYFCGGGCWSHAVAAHGTLEHPDEEKACRIIRRQIELSMAVNAAIGVSDQEILTGIYEESTLAHLKA